jgi:peptide/nickel transport system permease protein
MEVEGKEMLAYLLRRALASLVALALFVTFMFFVTEIMIPNDFTVQFSLECNRACREAMREELGIDLPLGQRYLNWMGRLLHGNLGMSLYGEPVVERLKRVVPYTLLVFFIGSVIAFQVGLWLGKATGWRGPGFLSGTAVVASIGFYTMFPPWLAFLVAYFFAQYFRILPFIARLIGFVPSQNLGHELNPNIWETTSLTVPTVMFWMSVMIVGMMLLLAGINWLLRRTRRWRLPALVSLPILVAGWIGSWYLFGFGPQALDIAFHASVPTLTYILLAFGETMLIMRTSLMDTLKEEYVIVARAKGLSEAQVRDRHAARTALLPVFSRLIVSFPYLLAGLVIMETAIGWPGLGGVMFGSFYQQDIPVVMGGLLLIGLVCTIARLVLDVVVAYLDPRIRYEVAASRRMV